MPWRHGFRQQTQTWMSHSASQNIYGAGPPFNVRHLPPPITSPFLLIQNVTRLHWLAPLCGQNDLKGAGFSTMSAYNDAEQGFSDHIVDNWHMNKTTCDHTWSMALPEYSCTWQYRRHCCYPKMEELLWEIKWQNEVGEEGLLESDCFLGEINLDELSTISVETQNTIF